MYAIQQPYESYTTLTNNKRTGCKFVEIR